MTIPSTPDFFLAQNVFGLGTGLPTDVAVNSFIFRNDADPLDVGSDINARITASLSDFYAGQAPAIAGLTAPSAQSILGLLSAEIASWTIKIYDLGDAPGERVPVLVDKTADLAAAGARASALPSEVACVLSLQTPIIGRRGRGRIFLGPLGSMIAVQDGHPIVPSAQRSRVAANAAKLALGNGHEVEWQVWSGTRALMARVVGGYVDDAPDTQRRRGIKATLRTKWGTTVPTQSPTP